MALTGTVEDQLSDIDKVLYRVLLLAARNNLLLRQPTGTVDEREALARTTRELNELVGPLKRLAGR